MEATPMRYANQERFRQQVQFLRRQFLQDGDLPFTNVLSEEIVSQSLAALRVFWKDRIYSPLVTLWVFLGQVLSADSCCRAAVARLIAALQPDVLVKGGDWTLDEIIGREEVEAAGGTVRSLPYVEGSSTSEIIERVIRIEKQRNRS